MTVTDFIKHEGIDHISSGRNTEEFFSRFACDCCQSTLAGDRYEIQARHTESNDIFNYDVCVDCYPELCG